MDNDETDQGYLRVTDILPPYGTPRKLNDKDIAKMMIKEKKEKIGSEKIDKEDGRKLVEEVHKLVKKANEDVEGGQRKLQDSNNSLNGGTCEVTNNGQDVRYAPPTAGWTGLDLCRYLACDNFNRCGAAFIYLDVRVIQAITSTPTGKPTQDITRTPTRTPTKVPTQTPTRDPASPTTNPTRRPSVDEPSVDENTSSPTYLPTLYPTYYPTKWGDSQSKSADSSTWQGSGGVSSKSGKGWKSKSSKGSKSGGSSWSEGTPAESWSGSSDVEDLWSGANSEDYP